MTRKERWEELKQQYPDTIILLMNGRFYEAYAEDAEKVSKTLHIPVRTHEQFGSVCRFGWRKLKLNDCEYLRKLTHAWKRVGVGDGDLF